MELYLRKEKFNGRRWLFKESNTKLLSRIATSRGVLLLAEMGYGKTSIVSHCACATPISVGFQVRIHVMAYLVCRFHVSFLPKTANTFIKRLAAMVSRPFPEFLKQITDDSAYTNILKFKT